MEGVNTSLLAKLPFSSAHSERVFLSEVCKSDLVRNARKQFLGGCNSGGWAARRMTERFGGFSNPAPSPASVIVPLGRTLHPHGLVRMWPKVRLYAHLVYHRQGVNAAWMNNAFHVIVCIWATWKKRYINPSHYCYSDNFGKEWTAQRYQAD